MLKCINNFCSRSMADLGLLVLRVVPAAFMILNHGLFKVMSFSRMVEDGSFLPVLGSVMLGLSLAIFAEVLMSLFVILGLFTRLSVIPLMVTMLVAAFIASAGQPFAARELALLYLMIFTTLFFTGPGKYSLDYQLFRKKK